MLKYLLALYLIWLAGLYFLQERLIFPGRGLTAGDGAAALPRAGEALWLTHENGQRSEAWFIPGRGRTPESPGSLVLFGHGNGELIDSWPGELRGYTERGVSVLLVEFRGYGRSGGTPSQAGIVDDFVAFYDRVVKRPDVDPTRVVFHGRSLGGGVVAQLAARRKPAALILESTFANLIGMAHRYLAPGFLVRHPFRTDLVLRRLDVPILILHGRRDTIVPVAHARRLHRIARDSKLILFDAGHNDFPGDTARYWSELDAFLHRHGLVD